jgi:hypothetical protein
MALRLDASPARAEYRYDMRAHYPVYNERHGSDPLRRACVADFSQQAARPERGDSPMSMQELADAYCAEAKNLEALISWQRKRATGRLGDSNETRRLERLIELHTQQRNDLLRLSGWMRGYYSHEMAGEQNDT